ncbi:MAG: PEP-CTERM sorting domain-containing protein [Planctomycetota bacterium]|nr:PEP-CTERM sorting domain-containing protein [Planctomycetota bacterium]
MKLAGILALGMASTAFAGGVITLDFEGIGNLNAIGNYYDGGAGGNLGVQFVGNTLAIVDSDAGGSGNFANEITPSTIMFFLTGNATIMNVPAGFINAFSLYYTSISATGSYAIYDGLNGTGNLLASDTLAPLGTTGGGGDPTGAFNRWALRGTGFNGVAKSVVFGGVADQIGFDNVVFGDIPAPGAAALALAGLVGAARRRRA